MEAYHHQKCLWFNGFLESQNPSPSCDPCFRRVSASWTVSLWLILHAALSLSIVSRRSCALEATDGSQSIVQVRKMAYQNLYQAQLRKNDDLNDQDTFTQRVSWRRPLPPAKPPHNTEDTPRPEHETHGSSRLITCGSHTYTEQW